MRPAQQWTPLTVITWPWALSQPHGDSGGSGETHRSHKKFWTLWHNFITVFKWFTMNLRSPMSIFLYLHDMVKNCVVAVSLKPEACLFLPENKAHCFLWRQKIEKMTPISKSKTLLPFVTTAAAPGHMLFWPRVMGTVDCFHCSLSQSQSCSVSLCSS